MPEHRAQAGQSDPGSLQTPRRATREARETETRRARARQSVAAAQPVPQPPPRSDREARDAQRRRARQLLARVAVGPQPRSRRSRPEPARTASQREPRGKAGPPRSGKSVASRRLYSALAATTRGAPTGATPQQELRGHPARSDEQRSSAAALQASAARQDVCAVELLAVRPAEAQRLALDFGPPQAPRDNLATARAGRHDRLPDVAPDRLPLTHLPGYPIRRPRELPAPRRTPRRRPPRREPGRASAGLRSRRHRATRLLPHRHSRARCS